MQSPYNICFCESLHVTSKFLKNCVRDLAHISWHLSSLERRTSPTLPTTHQCVSPIAAWKRLGKDVVAVAVAVAANRDENRKCVGGTVFYATCVVSRR